MTWRILSVEDDTINRALLRATLASASDARIKSAELVEATTLTEGRSALVGAAYDLVLLDRRLPDGDGFALAREVSTLTGSRPYVVALTADAVPATLAAALEAGCDIVVTKPYLPVELVGVILRALDRGKVASAQSA